MFFSRMCAETAGRGIITDEFVENEVGIPSVHSATIAETQEGLVVAFFGGKYEGSPDVDIYVCRKEGKKWTAPVKAANGVVDDTLRKACYNPVLYQVPGKRELLLFYKIGKNVQDWKAYLIRSYDCGRSWSRPEALPAGFLGPVKNKPVLVGGTLVCGSSTENEGWRVHLEFSSDWGKNWTKTGTIGDSTKWQVIQPSLFLHSDGRLQMLCRSKNEAVVSAFSSDGGRAWGPFSALDLPNNNSGIDAVALKDGRFLIVYNHVKAVESAYIAMKRTPLNVAISSDGLHWKDLLVLENSSVGEYSYPSVIQGKNGKIHIVYTWKRERIKYVELDLNH